MTEICDLCHTRSATMVGTIKTNNEVFEYHFCDECFSSIRSAGLTPLQVVQEMQKQKGNFCPVCGLTAAEFAKTYMFGCPECYKFMRKIALDAAMSSQCSLRNFGKKPRGKQ